MNQNQAEAFLEPITDPLFECFQNTLRRIINLDPSFLIDSTKRTRSSLLNDFFYAEIERSTLTDNRFFRPDKIRGLRVFKVIEGKQLMMFRLKKLFGKKLLGLNNNTNQTSIFDSQYPLEGQGFYTEISNIILGYKSDFRNENFTLFATCPFKGYNSWVINLGSININNLQKAKVTTLGQTIQRTNKLKVNLPNKKSI